MVTYAQLRDFQASTLTDAADAWQQHAAHITEQQETLADEVRSLSGWQGDAAEAARAHFRGLDGNIADSLALISRIPAVLRDAAEDIDAAQRLIEGAIAQDHGRFEITGTGEVILGEPPTAETALQLAALQEIVDRALRQATEADEHAASALRALEPAHAGLGDVAMSVDMPSGSPEEVREAWNSLSPIQQQTLINTHSAQIGGMDGIPVEARDRANRIVLAEHQAILQTQQGQYPEGTGERTRIDQRLAAIDDISARLASTDPEPAYLIHFDAQDIRDEQNPGRFILATGNPDTADNVVTNVHGISSVVDGTVSSWIDRSDATVNAAQNAAPGESTASIVWYGYDAPIGGEFFSESYAADARDGLQNFQEGLRATDDGTASSNTVVGHSYGSTVVGHAAATGNGGLEADQVAFVGSVGTGTPVGDASDLELHTNEGTVQGDATNVFAGRTVNDFVQYGLGGAHGSDPMSDTYGAYQFETGDGGLNPVNAHSAPYWEDPESVSNIGEIVTDGTPTVEADSVRPGTRF